MCSSEEHYADLYAPEHAETEYGRAVLRTEPPVFILPPRLMLHPLRRIHRRRAAVAYKSVLFGLRGRFTERFLVLCAECRVLIWVCVMGRQVWCLSKVRVHVYKV